MSLQSVVIHFAIFLAFFHTIEVVLGKIITLTEKVLIMDDNDKIVGTTFHTFSRDEDAISSKPPLPSKFSPSFLKIIIYIFCKNIINR